MHALAELQAGFAHAMTTGEARRFDAELVGGTAPRKRLGIHLRHYERSLTSALLDKFPACTWLLGSELVRAAARAYARRHPPEQPCIADYGRDFAQFLASFGRAASLPYVESFAFLEWSFGQVSIATNRPPCPWAELAAVGPDRLVDAALALQPGLHYRSAKWRIDELMTTYLRGAPERFVLVESSVFIEVHGSRGSVSLRALDEPTFVFRAALAGGQPIGDAAAAALERDAAFDAGGALKLLAGAGLVTGLSAIPRELEAP